MPSTNVTLASNRLAKGTHDDNETESAPLWQGNMVRSARIWRR